eukprot:gene502-632_t
MIYSWGSGSQGQLGINNLDDVSVPTKIVFKEAEDDGCNGKVYTFGSNDNGQLGLSDILVKLKTVPSLISYFNESNIKIVNSSAGWNHSLFIDEEGMVWGCGSNSHSQLGVKSIVDTTGAITNSTTDKEKNEKDNSKENGDIENDSGKSTTTFTRRTTGTDTNNTDNNNNCDNNRDENRNQNNECHTLDSTSTTTTKEQQQQQEQEQLIYYTPIKLNYFSENKIKVKSISCGQRHTIALSSNQDVYAWGSNKFGQLSVDCDSPTQKLPKKINSLQFKIDLISTGFKHTLVYSSENKSIYSFGNNKYGQLGIGNTIDQLKPSKVSNILDENGNDTISNIGEIKELLCGWSNSCFLTQDGGLYICGRGEFGVLGDGSNSGGVRTHFKILNAPPFNEAKISSIAMGSEHIICKTTDNKIYSFGWNEHFQLGLSEPVIPGIDGTNQHSPCLVNIESNDNSVISCGSGNSFIINT